MPKRITDYVICTECGNRKLNEAVRVRARKAGNAAYLKSLQKGELSMSDRGKLGGRPRNLTLAELLDADGPKHGGVGAPREVGVQPSLTVSRSS